jgi:hypothetical protein
MQVKIENVEKVTKADCILFCNGELPKKGLQRIIAHCGGVNMVYFKQGKEYFRGNFICEFICE